MGDDGCKVNYEPNHSEKQLKSFLNCSCIRLYIHEFYRNNHSLKIVTSDKLGAQYNLGPSCYRHDFADSYGVNMRVHK